MPRLVTSIVTRVALGVAGLALAAACSGPGAAEPPTGRSISADAPTITERDTPAMLHQVDLTAIDGSPLPFAQFEGKAVLVVNTASRCGYTPQYEGLQTLWERYREAGLVVLGVPSNDFGGQEPGTEADVQRFCQLNYGVDFPLTEKTKVIGASRHPLYAGFEDALGEAARPKWNFHKVLVDPQGQPSAAFPSSVAPLDQRLISEIEAVLPAG